MALVLDVDHVSQLHDLFELHIEQGLHHGAQLSVFQNGTEVVNVAGGTTGRRVSAPTRRCHIPFDVRNPRRRRVSTSSQHRASSTTTTRSGSTGPSLPSSARREPAPRSDTSSVIRLGFLKASSTASPTSSQSRLTVVLGQDRRCTELRPGRRRHP